MGILCGLLQLYVLIIIGRVIFSYFPLQPGGAMAAIDNFLRLVTDPVLEPLRRALPPARFGGAALDFSPLILIVGIQFLVVPFVCR